MIWYISFIGSRPLNDRMAGFKRMVVVLWISYSSFGQTFTPYIPG
jgi:hypothetical protein